MVICENWAVAPERAAAFFESQPGVTSDGSAFFCGSCRVTLTPIHALLLGQWPMIRTGLRIEGPEAEARALYHRFYLQFLSAGG